MEINISIDNFDGERRRARVYVDICCVDSTEDKRQDSTN